MDTQHLLSTLESVDARV